MDDDVKKLYRSNEDRMLAGVCGGIGAYFDLDPTLIRILFILFALAVGGGIFLYLILWLLIPLEPETPVEIVEGMAEEEEEA